MKDYIWIFFICSLSLFAREESLLQEGVIIDLRNPEIRSGSLYTEEGGVVQTSQLRIQAQKINYIREESQESVEAFYNVIIDYGDYHIVADAIYYNFTTKEGVITIGRSGYGIWYFGGTEIILHADGGLTLKQGYLTTSDLLSKDWKLDISTAHLSSHHHLKATSIVLYAGKLPLFYLPQLQTNLDWITDHPFRYRLRWGGKQGLRFGITYLAHEWGELKTYVRLDYRIKRGLGGGVETLWKPKTKAEEFHTINYIANDSSFERKNQKTRYRLGGAYHGEFRKGHTIFDFSYDRVSDEDMPNDYYDDGLALDTVCRTQIHLHHQKEDYFLSNFHTRVRINNFQTVKQELPSITISHHPFVLGRSGILMENSLSAGYLNFRFAHNQPSSRNFESSRCEWMCRLYRPIHFSSLTLTPQASYHTIFYGTTPEEQNKWLQVALWGAQARSTFHRLFNSSKHVIEPYADYTCITTPSLSPHEHYIFDINDGWHSLHALRFGTRQYLFSKTDRGIKRWLYSDLFAYSFFNDTHIRKTIPRIYQETTWDLSDTLRQSMDIAWDLHHSQLAHLNLRTEWTISEDFAFRAEYRHRNAFDYRKADYFNFILEAARGEDLLVHSLLSDRRDTLLCHLFYRLQYNVTAEFEFRHGWNRKEEPCYTEYQIDLTTTLRSHWNIRLSWQNREHDHRLVFNISLGS